VGSSWDVSAGALDTRRFTRRRKDIKFREAVLAEELEGLPLNKARDNAEDIVEDRPRTQLATCFTSEIRR
jgi:hypothetical protein